MATFDDNFDNVLSRIMGRGASIGSAPERAETIEQAAAAPKATATTSVGVVQGEAALPLVTEDMSLKDLRQLMEKYSKVVERGAYLYEWTGGKAAKAGTLDPRELGRERMTAIEKRALEWWEANGNKNEFDWSEIDADVKIPEGKVGKYNDELSALRWMYSNKDLEMKHWFWVRKNSEARAHVVWALVKIVKASQDLTNGMDTNDALGVAEYQTVNKIISVASTNVRTFMDEIHKLLRPIDDGLNMVIARRIEMGERLGIKQKKVGTANRQAHMFGEGKVGKITKPDDVPQGKKRVREETTTIDALRKLKVSRKNQISGPASHDLPSMGRGGEERTAPADPLEYRPKSPTPPPEPPKKVDLSAQQAGSIRKYMREGKFTPSAAAEFQRWDAPEVRTSIIQAASLVDEAGDRKSLAIPRGANRAETVLLSFLSTLVSTRRLTEDELATALFDVNLWHNAARCAFGTHEEGVAAYKKMLSEVEGDENMGEL